MHVANAHAVVAAAAETARPGANIESRSKDLTGRLLSWRACARPGHNETRGNARNRRILKTNHTRKEKREREKGKRRERKRNSRLNQAGHFSGNISLNLLQNFEVKEALHGVEEV